MEILIALKKSMRWRARMRRAGVLAADGFIAAGSLWIAMLLRFEGTVRPPFLGALLSYLLLIIGARVVSNMAFRLQRWSFLLSGLRDAVRVGYAGLLGSGLFVLSVYFFRLVDPPRSVVVLEFFMSTVFMGLLRFSPRLAWMFHVDRLRGRREPSLRTVIVGAGAAGEMLLRDLQRSHEHNYSIVGFVDDKPEKWGSIVGGKPILGGVQDLGGIVKRLEVGTVLIAIPRISARRIREILSLCSDLRIRFKILPVSYVYLHERAALSMLQDLSPEDLLQREPIDFAETEQAISSRGRKVLVTGAAGSIGSEICSQLLESGVGQVVLVDLNENGLYLLQRRLEQTFPAASIKVEVANIRDEVRLRSLFAQYRPQDVFHAAAHKHVPLMEIAPCEAVKNNVMGTRCIVHVADGFGVERFVLISTDKAVRPTSVMGATKRVAEFLVRSMASGSTTRFSAVRFGNVLGSAGSVVPIFREQIAVGGPVTVTHPEVRRYFMTISEAVGLVLRAAYGQYGTLCILEMGEQIRIAELAKHMITMAGFAPELEIPIVYTGLRSGEKLFEEVLTDEEEQTRRSADKIHIVDASPVPSDLDARVDALIEAALDEKATAVVALLQELVPTYQPSRGDDTRAGLGGGAVALKA